MRQVVVERITSWGGQGAAGPAAGTCGPDSILLSRSFHNYGNVFVLVTEESPAD